MAKLDNVIVKTKTSAMSIDKLCQIKRYLPIKDKMLFLKEYNDLMLAHQKDYDGMEACVGFVFFYLLLI